MAVDKAANCCTTCTGYRTVWERLFDHESNTEFECDDTCPDCHGTGDARHLDKCSASCAYVATIANFEKGRNSEH